MTRTHRLHRSPPLLRLLLPAAIANAVLKDYIYAKVIAAGVDVSNETLHLSDHFPVYFHWRSHWHGDINNNEDGKLLVPSVLAMYYVISLLCGYMNILYM